MAKIKITFDANPLVGNKTGVGQLTEELIVGLANKNPDKLFIGHYFDFLSRKKPNNLPVASNIEYRKTIFFPTKAVSLLRRIGVQLPFEFFCRVHANTILFPNFITQPSIFKSKSVIFIYDMCFVDYPEFVSDKNGNYLRKWAPKSLKNADKVVTISEFTKKRIIEVYSVNPEKIIVIPVPPKQKSIPDSSILKRLGLNEYLLFVGTLEPRKNINSLLNAYELLPKEIQYKFPLVLVGGKGWKDETIIQKIEQMQKANLQIIQTGYVSDAEKSALYESCTVALQLSHYEGFGMPVLEAMSYSKPVICSDIEVFHEIAADTVVYVDKDNPEDIKNKLSALLISEIRIKELSAKSKKHVSKYPTWENVATLLTIEIDL